MNALASTTLNSAQLPARIGLADWLARAVAAVKAIGPYAAIEIILPGGTLLAFLLWLYRRHQRGEPLPPVIAQPLSKVRRGVRRIVAAARGVGRSGLAERDVAVSVDAVCARG